MVAKIKRSIAIVLTLLLAVGIFVPMQTQAESSKPQVFYDDLTVNRNKPGTHFYVGVYNCVKGANYSATVSDSKVAKLINAQSYPNEGYVYFDFYAKKSGTVKVTIKQTYKKKTKKIKTLKFTIKSKSFSDKQKKKEKEYIKIVDSGSDVYSYGVSLEVLKISNIKNKKNKVTAKVTFRHKVTNAEFKAFKASKNDFVVRMESKGGKSLNFTGKLKKGKNSVTLTMDKRSWNKADTKKGKVAYVTGLREKKNTPYRLKVKF